MKRTLTGIVIAEHVTAESEAKAVVEAAHLTEVDGVAVGEEQREVSVVAARLYVHAGDSVSSSRPRIEYFHILQFCIAVGPVGSAFDQLQRVSERTISSFSHPLLKSEA